MDKYWSVLQNTYYQFQNNKNHMLMATVQHLCYYMYGMTVIHDYYVYGMTVIHDRNQSM